MENPLAISKLNDFIFCPLSIYFHGLFEDAEKMAYQSEFQLNGTAAHRAVDSGEYSDSGNILQSLPIYCEEYGLYGNIDTLDTLSGTLTERKKHISVIYDGYIFQLYAEYFALCEMGYAVKKLNLYSYDDNKMFGILLPEENPEMPEKFLNLLSDIQSFDLDLLKQSDLCL